MTNDSFISVTQIGSYEKFLGLNCGPFLGTKINVKNVKLSLYNDRQTISQKVD